MALNKARHRPGEEHHKGDRHDDRRDHDLDLLDHADGGNHRIEREHRIQQKNLHDDAGKRRRHLCRRVAALAFEIFVNFKSRLGEQKQPPASKIRSRPEISCAKTVKSGAVNAITHDRENSKITRITSAEASPTLRPRFCCRAGNFPARIEINTMLSTPRTISKATSVAKAIHACGSRIQSIIHILPTYRWLHPPSGEREYQNSTD